MPRRIGYAGKDTRCQLFGRHFQRKYRHAFVVRIHLVVIAHKLGNIIGDIHRQRRLAHRRTAGKNYQVRIVQTAHTVVQVVQPGGQARHFAFLFVSFLNHLQGRVQRGTEILKAFLPVAVHCQIKQPFFRFFYLGGGRFVQRFAHRFAGNVVTGGNQLTAQIFVIDELGIIFHVGQRRRGLGKLYQISDAADVV